MTSWNYSIQTTSPYGATLGATTAATPVEPASRYSAEQISLLHALVRDPANSDIASRVLGEVNSAGLGNNVRDGERVLDIINHAFGNPVGNDPMTASPTTLAVATAIGEQQLLQQSGRDSTAERDIEVMKPRVENRVKELMASGASREQIESAARSYGSTPALADIAAEIATQQYDANRNPLADIAPQLVPATTETAAAGNNVLQDFLVGTTSQHSFAEEEARRQASYRTLSGPIPAMQPFANIDTTAIGSHTPSYELLGDLSPTQGLPNLKGGPARGGPDFA